MRKKRSILMPILSTLMLLAVVVLVVYMVVNPQNLGERLSGQSAEIPAATAQNANVPTITSEYAGLYYLYVDVAHAEIRISASPDDVCRVSYPQDMRLTLEHDAEAADLLLESKEAPSHMLPFLQSETKTVIEIAIPDLITLQVSAQSGNVQVADVRADEVYVRTGSGDIAAHNIETADYLMLASDSGNVGAFNFYAPYVYAETQSGRVHLEQAYASEIYVYTVSGNQHINCEMGAYVELYAQSGAIDLQCAEPIEGSANASSGDVTVHMPAAPQSVAFHTKSGNVNYVKELVEAVEGHSAYWSQTYQNQPSGPVLRVETDSGDLSIN